MQPQELHKSPPPHPSWWLEPEMTTMMVFSFQGYSSILLLLCMSSKLNQSCSQVQDGTWVSFARDPRLESQSVRGSDHNCSCAKSEIPSHTAILVPGPLLIPSLRGKLIVIIPSGIPVTSGTQLLSEEPASAGQCELIGTGHAEGV